MDNQTLQLCSPTAAHEGCRYFDGFVNAYGYKCVQCFVKELLTPALTFGCNRYIADPISRQLPARRPRGLAHTKVKVVKEALDLTNYEEL